MSVTDVAKDWSPARRARAAEKLAVLRRRAEIIRSVEHPAQLAASCEPEYRITPAIELLSKSVEKVLRGRRRRLMITMGPQEGKSSLCAVWTPLRALQLHPNWSVMLLTYADGLAEEHSRKARSYLQQFGTGVTDSLTGQALPDRLGISLSEEKATAGNWIINEGRGGLLAAGREATITGRQSNLLIIDDPYKGMTEADSTAIRAKVDMWYRSVATTRLAADASIIIINTRWHPADLSGTLLAEDSELPAHLREWRYLNIPALSHPALPDALGRPPGVYLESTRGRTQADWEATQRNAGKRVWNALYQGSPTPPEGGLFSEEWFDAHRMPEMPDRTRARIVAVDPSESGEGDEAGVIAAALLYPPSKTAQALAKIMGDPDAPPEIHPQVLFTHDRSAQMTSDQWAKAAVQLALDTDASDIFIETYTAGTTYVNVVKAEILARSKTASQAGDNAAAHRIYRLYNRVHGWRGSGDSVARSGLLRQAVEVGTCVMLGHEMATLELQARLWNVGQHQPDRVAAGVIAHDRLMFMAGQQAVVAKPATGAAQGRTAPAWLSRKVG